MTEFIKDSTIEMANAEHAMDLCLIHQECFERNWDQQYYADLLTASNVCAFVAKQNGMSITTSGFILTRWVRDEAELLSIAVLPQLRRRGLARKLCVACFSSLLKRNVKEIFLEVAETNEEAANLYKSLGFKPVGLRKSYYTTSESDQHQDALVMKLNLKSGGCIDQEADKI